ncbi:MAG: hypothetical protein ACOCYU_01670 [Brevefilum sp.]
MDQTEVIKTLPVGTRKTRILSNTLKFRLNKRDLERAAAANGEIENE